MERPILFSTPMVQAILDGRKTQTRRLSKLDHINSLPKLWNFLDRIGGSWKNKAEFVYRFINNKDFSKFDIECPYGIPGDILWVRETWRIVGWNDGDPFVIQFKDGTKKRNVYLNESRAQDYVIECADQFIKAGYESDESGMFVCDGDKIPTKWRPSIFMPKEVCRIKLLIKDIRVERLQDISEEDAKAEGIIAVPYVTWETRYSESYAELWDKINGKSSWDKNPWVWVIEFERLKTN